MSVDDIFNDKPKVTPGKITYRLLFDLLEWQIRHGISDTTEETIEGFREDGYRAWEVGLELGLIDYPQASGCVD